RGVEFLDRPTARTIPSAEEVDRLHQRVEELAEQIENQRNQIIELLHLLDDRLEGSVIEEIHSNAGDERCMSLTKSVLAVERTIPLFLSGTILSPGGTRGLMMRRTWSRCVPIATRQWSTSTPMRSSRNWVGHGKASSLMWGSRMFSDFSRRLMLGISFLRMGSETFHPLWTLGTCLLRGRNSGYSLRS